jgi:hypothetical protein
MTQRNLTDTIQESQSVMGHGIENEENDNDESTWIIYPKNRRFAVICQLPRCFVL